MNGVRKYLYRAILALLIATTQGCISANILSDKPLALEPSECIVLMRIIGPKGELSYSVGSIHDKNNFLPRSHAFLRVEGKDVFLLKLGSGEHYKIGSYAMDSYRNLNFRSKRPTYFSCQPGIITYVGDLIFEPVIINNHIRGLNFKIQDNEIEILEAVKNSHPNIISRFKFNKDLARKTDN